MSLLYVIIIFIMLLNIRLFVKLYNNTGLYYSMVLNTLISCLLLLKDCCIFNCNINLGISLLPIVYFNELLIIKKSKEKNHKVIDCQLLTIFIYLIAIAIISLMKGTYLNNYIIYFKQMFLNNIVIIFLFSFLLIITEVLFIKLKNKLDKLYRNDRINFIINIVLNSLVNCSVIFLFGNGFVNNILLYCSTFFFEIILSIALLMLFPNKKVKK